MHKLLSNVNLGIRRWRTDPVGTAADVAVSALGQFWFVTFGQDNIGVGMDAKLRPGLGHKIAPKIAARFEPTPTVCWTIKAIEILSDATKMPIEGYLYRRDGVVPDAVACVVTQPAWSAIEVAEKLVGVCRHPDRVTTQEQLEDSISSIYGTWTRNSLSLVLYYWGPQIREKLGPPVERAIRGTLASDLAKALPLR